MPTLYLLGDYTCTCTYHKMRKWTSQVCDFSGHIQHKALAQWLGHPGILAHVPEFSQTLTQDLSMEVGVAITASVVPRKSLDVCTV